MEKNKIFYKIGCNFDLDLIEGISKINDKYGKDNIQINEFYGSDRNHSFLAARPDFRLPNVSKNYLKKYVKKSSENNIEFNYTLNSIFPGSKSSLSKKEKKIRDWIKYLEDVGVKRVTIANPLILEIVRETSPTIDIEISTISHIDSVTQIKYLHEKYKLSKICGNLLKNRSIKFLKNCAIYCNDNGIILDLMVNEFCGVGSDQYATHCPYRDSCYLCLKWDSKIFDVEGKKYWNIKDIPVGTKVESYNKKSNKKVITTINKIIPKGKKKVFRIKTKSGKFIEVTEDHDIFTPVGWNSISKGLKIGDKIMTNNV